MAVVGARRRDGTGSVYRLHNGSWQGALRGPGRLRRYVTGPTRDTVERKLEQLRRPKPRLPASATGRGHRSEIRARNVLKIIELTLIRAETLGWSKERTAEVLAAWLSPRRVTVGVWGPCVYCGEEAASTVDHAIPRIRGGTDEPDNLVSACSSCNNRKGDRTADEFRQHRSW